MYGKIKGYLSEELQSIESNGLMKKERIRDYDEVSDLL